MAGTPSAAAHQFWLAPSDYRGSAGRPIAIGALAGTGFRGERKPWSPPHGARFVARTARVIDLGRAASPGDLTWTRFAPTDGGGAMIAFESTFTPIELTAGLFDAYLMDEGLLAARSARARLAPGTPGRERYRRAAKAWLSGDDVSRATTPVGLPLEIVPRAIPGAGATLPLVVLRSGRPLPRALVKAWRALMDANAMPTDAEARDSVVVAWQGLTDALGRATVPTAAAGEWLVSVVDMTPCTDRGEADWESTWASLTFARSAGRAAAASARAAR